MANVVNGIIILDNRILLFKKREYWILPGGKSELGELHFETLVREFKEEASESEIMVNDFYKTFCGLTPISKREVSVHAYFAELIKPNIGLCPSNEILDIRFIGNHIKYNLSEITLEIVNSLIKDKYLKYG